MHIFGARPAVRMIDKKSENGGWQGRPLMGHKKVSPDIHCPGLIFSG
jgi:hypothetical protein